jgi:PAS domain S-box-containing protein
MNAIEKAQSGVDPASPENAEPSPPQPQRAPEVDEVAAWLLDGRYLTVDAQGVVTTWSARAQETFGWTRNDVVGTSFTEALVDAADRDRQEELLSRLLGGDVTARLGADVGAQLAGGDPVRATFTAVPIRVAVGYEFNSLLRGISSRSHAGSRAELKDRQQTTVALIDDALSGSDAARADSDDTRRIAGALIAFGVRRPPPPQPEAPADNVVPIAEAASSRLDEARREAEDARAHLRAVEAQLEEAQREARRARNEAEVAHQETSSARDSVAAAQRRADAAEQALANARGHAEEAAAARETARIRMEDALHEASRIRGELLETRAEAHATVARLESDLDRAREDLDRTERELAASRGEAERVSAELEQARAERQADSAEPPQLLEARARLERMEAVFERAPVGAILTAPDGAILEVNRVVCDMLGHARATLVGDDPPSIVHPDDVDAKRDLARRMLLGEQVTARGYRRYMHADGYAITMRESTALLRDRDGEPLMFLFQLEDADGGEQLEQVVVDADVAPDDGGRARGGGEATHASVRKAIEDEMFVLHCQPVLDLHSNAVAQYELLLRMIAEGGRLLLPQVFLEPARRAGLAGAIDRWVVRRAFALLGEDPHGDRSLEVNLSPEAIHDPGLPELIEQELAATLIDPARLILEITSQTAVEDLHRSQELAKRLRSLGCRFALDDFRSTFGSFRLLKDLPLDYLKLDGDLVSSLSESRTSQLIVKAIVDVASATGAKTVAVFVSDDQTLAHLRQYGVDYAQGYSVGRPQPVEELWSVGKPALPPASQ